MPSREAIQQQILATIRHSCAVEYFINELGLNLLDPERPHDIVGSNSKFDQRVLLGLALQYDPNPDQCEVIRARDLHRQQYHHLIWTDEPIVAFEGDFVLGGVDAICSMLENRPYQGGPHSWKDIATFIGRQNLNPKFYWLQRAFHRMKEIGRPDIEHITSVTDFPNIGLPEDIYNSIRQRAIEVEKEFF